MSAPSVVMGQASPAVLLAPVSQGAATVNTAGFDLTGYEGVVVVTQLLGVLTGTIGSQKLQTSHDNSVWVDITSAQGTFSTLTGTASQQSFDVRSARRWLRYQAVVATNPVLISVNLNGLKKVTA